MEEKKCKFSEKGKKVMKMSSKLFSIGIVKGETMNERGYKVLWKGSKTPTTYHKSFIEILE